MPERDLVPLFARVPAEVRDQLVAACDRGGRTIQSVVTEALRAWLALEATRRG